MTELQVLRFLRTPKTARQLIAEFGGLGTVQAIRRINDKGMAKVVCAPVWQDGTRFLYVVDEASRATYNRRRFAKLGADWDAREIV